MSWRKTTQKRIKERIIHELKAFCSHENYQTDLLLNLIERCVNEIILCVTSFIFFFQCSGCQRDHRCVPNVWYCEFVAFYPRETQILIVSWQQVDMTELLILKRVSLSIESLVYTDRRHLWDIVFQLIISYHQHHFYPHDYSLGDKLTQISAEFIEFTALLEYLKQK